MSHYTIKIRIKTWNRRWLSDNNWHSVNCLNNNICNRFGVNGSLFVVCTPFRPITSEWDGNEIYLKIEFVAHVNTEWKQTNSQASSSPYDYLLFIVEQKCEKKLIPCWWLVTRSHHLYLMLLISALSSISMR